MEKLIILVSVYYLLLFLRNTYQRDLSFKDADDEQSKWSKELKGIDKDIKLAEESLF